MKLMMYMLLLLGMVVVIKSEFEVDAEDAEPEDVAEFLADHEGALEDQAERFGAGTEAAKNSPYWYRRRGWGKDVGNEAAKKSPYWYRRRYYWYRRRGWGKDVGTKAEKKSPRWYHIRRWGKK